MSKARKDFAEHFIKTQLSFLQQMEGSQMIAGSLNIDAQVRACITDMIAKSGKSRHTVIAEVNELCATDYQKSTLDGWTADSRPDSNIPVKVLPALVMSTGQFNLLDLTGKYCGCQILRGKESVLAEIARLDNMKLELEQQKDELQKLMLKLK